MSLRKRKKACKETAIQKAVTWGQVAVMVVVSYSNGVSTFREASSQIGAYSFKMETSVRTVRRCELIFE